MQKAVPLGLKGNHYRLPWMGVIIQPVPMSRSASSKYQQIHGSDYKLHILSTQCGLVLRFYSFPEAHSSFSTAFPFIQSWHYLENSQFQDNLLELLMQFPASKYKYIYYNLFIKDKNLPNCYLINSCCLSIYLTIFQWHETYVYLGPARQGLTLSPLSPHDA